MITAKLDVSKLIARCRKVPATLHAEIQKSVLSEAALLVSSSSKTPGLVQVTPPFSQSVKGNAAKKQGEAKIETDIRKVYGTPSDLWRLIRDKEGRAAADNFWAYMKLRRWTQANELALRIVGHQLSVFDGGDAHANRRDKTTGRVKGGSQPKDKTIFLNQDQEKSLRAYIRQQQGKVGMLASSIPTAAASKLGKINGLPSWVSRHRGRWGRCTIQKNSRSMSITLGISGRGVRDLQRRFGYVLGYRVKAFYRQLPYIKRHALKSAGMLR